MIITLDAITLPEGLRWDNEYEWTPVAQESQRSLTGAVVLTSGVKLKGRSIILAGDTSSVYISRLDLRVLEALLPSNPTMSLVIGGRAAIDVIFDHAATPIVSSPLFAYWVEQDDDQFNLQLKFLTV